MKRIMLFVTVAFLFVTLHPLNSQAQMAKVDIKPGVRAGLNFMTFGGDEEVDDFGRRTGFMVGGFALVDFGGPFVLQPEIMYVQKGATADASTGGGTFNQTFKLDYIEIPILAKFQLPVEGEFSPFLFAGPALGANINAKVESESGGSSATGDISDDVSSADFGLILGGGFDFSLSGGRATIDLRYGLGLANIDNVDDTIRNKGFMITAGYSF